MMRRTNILVSQSMVNDDTGKGRGVRQREVVEEFCRVWTSGSSVWASANTWRSTTGGSVQ